MIEIKKLSECTLDEATEAWNAGFSGYAFNLEVDVDGFTRRLGLDSLSPSHSLLSYVDGKPAGILLNGIKELNGDLACISRAGDRQASDGSCDDRLP